MKKLKPFSEFRKEVVSTLSPEARKLLTKPYRKHQYDRTRGFFLEMDGFRNQFYVKMSNSLCSRENWLFEKGFPGGSNNLNKRIDQEREELTEWVEERVSQLNKKYKKEIKKELRS